MIAEGTGIHLVESPGNNTRQVSDVTERIPDQSPFASHRPQMRKGSEV